MWDNFLCLVELCKYNPIATGKGVSSCRQCLVEASNFLLWVLTELNLMSCPILLATYLVTCDLLGQPSINNSMNCCKQKGTESFCFSIDTSPSKLLAAKSSGLIIHAALASAKLFSEHEFSQASNKALPTSPSRDNNMFLPFLLSYSPGTDSSRHSLNRVLWMFCDQNLFIHGFQIL